MKLPQVSTTLWMHGIGTVAAVVAIARFALGHPFDVGFGAWATSMFLSGAVNDKWNTPNPNITSMTITGVTSMVPPKAD